MKIRIGTRSSELARSQTGRVAQQLVDLGHEVSTQLIETAGDLDRTSPFHQVGPPGVFVREIEKAMLRGEIDVAVHSYKDLPTQSPHGLTIAAVAGRVDPADCLIVCREALADSEPLPLAVGARVGTSSARRAALLKELRPDLEIVPIRGNVPTRLRKLQEPDYDATLLASAGLERLGLRTDEPGEVTQIALSLALFPPAPAQGAIAVQVRSGDVIEASVRELDVPSARRAVDAERLLLARLEGGCQIACGAYAELHEDGSLTLDGAFEVEGELRRATESGADDAAVVERVALQLLGESGGAEPQPLPGS